MMSRMDISVSVYLSRKQENFHRDFEFLGLSRVKLAINLRSITGDRRG